MVIKVICFLMGLWLGYGLKLLTARAIIKISIAYHNLFISWANEVRKTKKLNGLD